MGISQHLALSIGGFFMLWITKCNLKKCIHRIHQNKKVKTDHIRSVYFSQIEKMEQVTNAVGNSTALLIERFFWLGIGVFLGLAIIKSFIRGLKENKTKPPSDNQLESLAQKAIQRNSANNW